MNVWHLASVVVVAGLATSVVAGCATMKKMSPEEAIAARQQLMKEQIAAWRAVQNKAKAGQIEAIAVDAEKLTGTSKRIPGVFPEGSLDPTKSRAKPEIRQKWLQFERHASALDSQAMKLRDASRTGDAQATDAVIAGLFRQTCDTCHREFRGPEIKR